MEKRKVNAFTFEEYSKVAVKTAIYPSVFQWLDNGHSSQLVEVTGVYAGLGLASEAGEVAGKLKKVIRDNQGVMPDEVKKQIIKECGDCLWYLAVILEELDSSLAYAAKENNIKLLDRQKRGVIQGSGDER